MSRAGPRIVAAATVFLGCYLCLVATIVYQHRTALGPVVLPWGTALGVGTVYVTAIGLKRWLDTAPALLMLGWGIGILMPIAAPSESFLIIQDAWGWTFIGTSVGVLVVAFFQTNRVQK